MGFGRVRASTRDARCYCMFGQNITVLVNFCVMTLNLNAEAAFKATVDFNSLRSLRIFFSTKNFFLT
jgi:hypothetical protein